MQLSKIGELGLIKKLQKKCKSNRPELITGIGDDAAVIKHGNKKVLITTDLLLEKIHFDLSFTTFYQLGYKFLGVNISDIFAMGGKPGYFFISLGIPREYKPDEIDELYSGILEIAEKFGIVIAGGDTCASRQGLVLSGTLMGTADRVITRGGAKAGDSIFVTGTLGDSAMGLELLQSQELKDRKISKLLTHNSKLIKKHLMPEPASLKNTSKITSMIDISDGLLLDLSHICDESKVGAVIYKDRIPVSKELASTARVLRCNPMDFALRGGEDYVLLFTAPQDARTDAYRIGEIIQKGRFIVDEKGRKTKFKPEGYEHFK